MPASRRAPLPRSLPGLLTALVLACGPAGHTPASRAPHRARQPELIELDPAAGQTCGGVRALECPEGFLCVDEASDDCEPTAGGADCTGVCRHELETVPPPVDCAVQDAARRYVESDPRLCAGLFFLCHPDETHFFDACGCGCGP